MARKQVQRKRKIPENLGNSLCGIWPYVVALVFDAVVHLTLFFVYGPKLASSISLFFSFIFFIYPLSYIADSLWSLRPSVCEILSGRLQINRKYYMNTVQKEIAREALLPVTISIPVYLEDNEVIFETLRDSMAAIKRYREYSDKAANIVVSDDGLAPMLGDCCTKEKADHLVQSLIKGTSILNEQERKAAERILFYRKHEIPFVVRPKNGRAGLFKKSSNLNYSLRLGNAVSNGNSLETLILEGQPFAGGYAEGDIVTNEIILLLDKDSGVNERIIEAIIPEFALDKKLAYVQCATRAINLNENYYSRATGHHINNLFQNVWPCKALQGFFVPLIGHNVFLRKSILEKSGLWSENKVSEDFDRAICFYSMGYHGKYAQLKGLEFTEYASRTFTEETGKQRRYAYGLFEMIFDGTIIPGKTRKCDLFYMILYMFSVINEVMLLPTVLFECYFGDVHLLWAGFLFCNICFICLPRIRGFIMRRRLPKEYIEKTPQTVIIALSFVGHSFSFLAGTCRYLANKIKANSKPFPSTSVDKLEYRFSDGVKLLVEYIRNNKWFLILAVLCIDRGIFMLTRKGFGIMTVFTYSYILFCAVIVPFLLTPQLFAGFKIKKDTIPKKEMESINHIIKNASGNLQGQDNKPTVWNIETETPSPQIVNESSDKEFSDHDIENFLGSYKKILEYSIPKESMPDELLANYSFESCLRKDPEGNKELYILRRKDDTKALLRITKDYPQEDAIEEAKLLRKLDHPGIPKVYDSYEYAGKKYIVREYIEGRSLYEIINTGGSLSTEDIFGVILKLTDILSYLHSRIPPVIHRDIKPQNIIVAEDGTIYLIDFGIARVHKEERFQDTSVILTLDYASPEQYGFEQTTPLSDIYSLGVVILYMATGRTIRKGLESQIVNNRLRSLIEQCIAFNPKSRFQSVDQIRDYIIRDRSSLVSQRRRSLTAVALLLVAAIGLSAFSYGMGFFTGKSYAGKVGYDQGYDNGYTDGYDVVPIFQIGGIQTDPKRGNRIGNTAIDGGAFAVQSEDFMFCILDGDIYMMSKNGAEIELLVQGKAAKALSFYNGWLYYSSGENILQTNIYTLESDLLCEELSGELCILNDNYYLETADGLSLLSTETGEVTYLNSFSSYSSLNIMNEKIFYINTKNHNLYSSDVDGKDLLKILDGDCRSVCLFEEDIFCSAFNNGSGKLLKINGSSGETEILAEVNALMLNVTENGIYFIDASSGTINLCSFDGRIRKRISKSRASDFNIAGDWIFYHNEADENRLWCVRLDGANDHPVQVGGLSYAD